MLLAYILPSHDVCVLILPLLAAVLTQRCSASLLMDRRVAAPTRRSACTGASCRREVHLLRRGRRTAAMPSHKPEP